MRRLTIPRIRSLDLRPPWIKLLEDVHQEHVTNLMLHGEEWNWPAVPECAGRRDAVTYPPIVVKNGEIVRVRSVYGPFGVTFYGAEVLHDN